MSTVFKDGIEFILPGIQKAYPRMWAEGFLSTGMVFFTNLEIFRAEEDSERGDSLEGTSVTIRQGVRCTANYLNPIFVWCGTMENEPETILATWRDRDTVIQITDPLAFTQRVRDAAVAHEARILSLQVGPVTYDKDKGSHRTYHWAEGLFQKNHQFNGQKEFRFALVGDPNLEGTEHIVLSLEDCTDIARISGLTG